MSIGLGLGDKDNFYICIIVLIAQYNFLLGNSLKSTTHWRRGNLYYFSFVKIYINVLYFTKMAYLKNASKPIYSNKFFKVLKLLSHIFSLCVPRKVLALRSEHTQKNTLVFLYSE